MFARRVLASLVKAPVSRRFGEISNRGSRNESFWSQPTTMLLSIVTVGIIGISYAKFADRRVTGTGLIGWGSAEDNGLRAAYTAQEYAAPRQVVCGSDSPVGSSYKPYN